VRANGKCIPLRRRFVPVDDKGGRVGSKLARYH
jgi:hypothetical protein